MTFAVLCPGQGGQHAGMLDLASANPAGLDVIARANLALGEDARSWLAQGEAMFRNAIAQPLICVAQLALWSVLRRDLDAPVACAGYSVGELACYGLADALDAGSLALDLAPLRGLQGLDQEKLRDLRELENLSVRATVYHARKQDAAYYIGLCFEGLPEEAHHRIVQWVHQVNSEIAEGLML